MAETHHIATCDCQTEDGTPHAVLIDEEDGNVYLTSPHDETMRFTREEALELAKQLIQAAK